MLNFPEQSAKKSFVKIKTGVAFANPVLDVSSFWRTLIVYGDTHSHFSTKKDKITKSERRTAKTTIKLGSPNLFFSMVFLLLLRTFCGILFPLLFENVPRVKCTTYNIKNNSRIQYIMTLATYKTK